jgi:hypothetical protein
VLNVISCGKILRSPDKLTVPDSIFSIADIDLAVKLGEQYANPDYNPKAAIVKYPYIEKDAEIYAVGADPGGWGHSRFGDMFDWVV